MRALRSAPTQAVLSLVVAAMVLAGLSAAPAAAQARPGPGESLAEQPTGRDGNRLPARAAERAKLPRLPEAAWHAEDVVTGRLVVTARTAAAAERVAARHGGAVIGGAVVVVPAPAGREAAAARVLAGDADVEAVEPDPAFEWLAEPNDPAYQNGQQWAHEVARAPAAWKHTTGDASVQVVVIDSGVDATHPDLADNVVAQAVVKNDLSVGAVAAPANNANCDDMPAAVHGTAVAGVVGAVGDNGVGVAGVAWDVGVVDVALMNDCSPPTLSRVIAALQWVAKEHPGAAVVNLSLGREQPECGAGLQKAIDNVRKNGTAVVAASGNTGPLSPYTRVQPAGCAGVITVGAVGPAGTLAHYSSRNRYVDVVAPGGDHAGGGCPVTACVRTTAPGGAYVNVQGTSFAAPYVAGVIALIHDHAGDRPPDKVEAILEQTARHPDGKGVHDERYGWGLIDAGQAVAKASENLTLKVHPRTRWSPGVTTAPIPQAVAVSRRLFGDGSAPHAVIARDDDYADALAGSSLAYGAGPLLFANRTGPLAAATRQELERVLAPGGRVYLLGGGAALPDTLEGELAGLGFHVRRLFGPTREHTAVEIARELDAVLGGYVWPEALLVTRGNWPDAVAAGSLGAYLGAPVLLTEPGELHPVTAAYLHQRRGYFEYVVAVGGVGVVSDAVLAQAGATAHAGVHRLSGPTRDWTATAVATAFEGMSGDSPFAITINLDRPDAYAHALSASAVSAVSGSPFVPVRAEGAVTVTRAGAEWACGKGYELLVAGGSDLVPEAIADELDGLLKGADPRC